MTWVVVGSSPSVTECLPRIELAGSRTITTNAGIRLLQPDVYFLFDRKACEMFGKVARFARFHGTRLLTLLRQQHAMEQRGVADFDEFADEREYEEFKLSGLFCVEYACRNGASVVKLAGMDGYAVGGMYFDGRPARVDRQMLKTLDVIQPRMQRLCEKYPDVQFEIYGEPQYTVDAENWSVQ